MLSIPNKPSLLLSSAVFTDLTLLICGAVVSINVLVVEILRVVLFPAISTISPLTLIESFSTNSFKASVLFKGSARIRFAISNCISLGRSFYMNLLKHLQIFFPYSLFT